MAIVRRRIFLQMAGGCVGGVLLSTARSQAQSTPKIVVGYPAVTPALPLYLALERGFFKQAGLNVEAIAFPNPQDVVNGIIAGQIQAAGNGVSSGNLAIGEATTPGQFKIFCSNASNARFVLEQFIVARTSPARSLSDLKGKKICCGLGPQNLAVAKAILTQTGYANPEIIPLAFDKHIQAIQTGQVDAAYTLEPVGTVGRVAGVTRTLEAGVVAKYILGDPLAPWYGGSAALSTRFMKEYPDAAQKFIAAYRQGVEVVRQQPGMARQYLSKYTSIKPQLVNRVPLPSYTLFDEFTTQDVQYFQQFFDFLQTEKVLSRPVKVTSVLLSR